MIESNGTEHLTAIVAQVALQSGNKIGESPIWDKRQQRFLWVDQALGAVYEARCDGPGAWRITHQWQLQPPIAAVIPRWRGFAVATDAQIVLLGEHSGAISSFTSLGTDPNLVRINEARCDPQGRLWVATLATDFMTPRAGLYRIDPDGQVTKMLHDVQVGNGLAWSMNSDTLYFADSMRQTVDAFDFHAERGTIHNRRVFARFERCVPDGLTVDRDDCVWIAAAGAGEIRRFTPQGRLIGRISVATPGVTSCAFGGPHYEDLLITSIGIQMPEVVTGLGVPKEKLTNDGPDAGAVFVCRPGASGKPITVFAA